MATFAVCRTAEIPPEVVDRFLSATYAESEELAPGLGPCLIVLGTQAGVGAATDMSATTAPGTAAALGPSPYMGKSATEVAAQLGAPNNHHFVVMDSRSAEDDTVLLATTLAEEEEEGGGGSGSSDGVQTVRATFASAQSVLVGLSMGTQGFGEVQSIATGSPNGVYGPERRGEGAGPPRGQPAPRKLLEAEE